MKKILTILFTSSFICLALGMLLRIGGWERAMYIVFAAHFLLMIATGLIPFMPDYRPKEIKMLSTIFCGGGVLFFAGLLLKDLRLSGNVYVLVAGLVVATLAMGVYLLLFLTGRVQKKRIDDKYAQAPVVGLSAAELETYIGNYTNKQVPLDISFKADGNALNAQATSQQPFALEAIGNHTFRFTKAGIVIIFDPSAKKLLLKQHGREFPFVKVN